VADTPVVDVPETRYATSGDVSIAYQVSGHGPYDLVQHVAEGSPSRSARVSTRQAV